jgi:GTP1/Obg family GTP-binding protein
MSFLSAFNTQLINFFEELIQVLPGERDVQMGLEAIKGAKKINPRLILDLFVEHVYTDLHEAIERKDIDTVQRVARVKIMGHFNEMMAALTIFDKHWNVLTPSTQEAIWKYLRVLCVLAEKARGSA